MYASTALAFTLATTLLSTVTAQAPNGKTNIAIASGATQSLGDLAGTNLINKVVALIGPACPEPVSDGTPTQCATDPLTIDDVPLISQPGEDLGGGSITFTINEGNYSYASQRDGMLGVFAQTLAAAAATKANCQSQHWQQGCTLGVGGGRKRGLANEPLSDCTRGVKTICSGPSNVDIEIDAVDGGDELAVLNIDITFVDPNVPFNCLSFIAAIGTGLGVMAFIPPIAAGAAAAAVGAISSGCGATGH